MISESSAKPTLEEASAPAQAKRPTPKHEFKGHEKALRAFVFLHDDIHIVSGSEDSTMRKWNCDTGLVVGDPWKGEGEMIYALALSPDGKVIACGRADGSVQRWNIDGKIDIIEGVWTGHGDRVRSLSWSPNGSHIASGSDDGTILIQGADSGKVEVGPMKMKQSWVLALAYSPSGDKIASGGYNETICISNTKTGELVVGPIKGLGLPVTSLVWSSDSTKLYSASDQFARVFDSTSGALLHRFEHTKLLYSVALSLKHNVLACVGYAGVAQLWDIESHQPLSLPFHQNRDTLYSVSFSRDESHLAYSGKDGKLTLWTVKDIAPQLPAPTLLQQGNRQSIVQEEAQSNSSSSSCLNADATGSDDFVKEAQEGPYHNFFQSSPQSLPSPSPSSRLPNLFSAHRFWKGISRRCPPPDQSVPRDRSKRKFFIRRVHPDSPLEPATMKPNRLVPEGKAREGEGKQGANADDHASANDPHAARKNRGKNRGEPPTDAQSLSSNDPTPPTDLDDKDNRNFWKRMMHTRGKDSSNTKTPAAIKHPEVVEVYAVRGFQRYVAFTRKKKSLPFNPPLAVPHTSGSSAASPSSQVGSAQPSTSSQPVSIQAGPSSHVVGAQVTGGPSTHASPSHFVTSYYTNHDSDSSSSIEGSCNRFLDKICFPRGHYH
ncbi:WD40-repeat-containing domain protein [Suillus placidus]|uniref:WD40-repeat-containing domain protein n=1 Tax=Suillus placidus TaxID=48579 RepID=A0A9P7D6A3_9AGAM|nr:WD40-repeat-containing domain protein [Suillus placidus]